MSHFSTGYPVQYCSKHSSIHCVQIWVSIPSGSQSAVEHGRMRVYWAYRWTREVDQALQVAVQLLIAIYSHFYCNYTFSTKITVVKQITLIFPLQFWHTISSIHVTFSLFSSAIVHHPKIKEHPVLVWHLNHLFNQSVTLPESSLRQYVTVDITI